MKKSIADYEVIIFDCDGVILNSNKVKTDAFYKTALPYGEAAARKLVEHHVQNGGVSRYKKFSFFLDSIVGNAKSVAAHEALLNCYATEVYNGLMACEIANDLKLLREKTSAASWFVASGGDQSELRKVFQARNISYFFDGGIFGSPDTKEAILDKQLGGIKSSKSVLFIGDSKYDFIVAKKFDLDFAYVSGWSEWSQAEDFSTRFDFNVKQLSDLVKV
ncbi:HAD family hydrolase [Halomonas sp. 141]|uniref:HAD family hydrolase n=1 Tax=Halomonas sp. 141 TaxID=2056666 RepID=UPI000C29D6AF|nr:HAD family hydrolase [Halomonas sp. 141]PJX13558.1 HAD family hydrolase [Halomonas sp. 141]